MKNIVIKSQSELDALPKTFSEFTVIEIRDCHCRVVARENSSVVARENSRVEAWGNSRVVAWGNSSVEAWGNSSVVAWENSSVHHYSCEPCLLFAFAAAWVFGKSRAVKRSKSATIIKVKWDDSVSGWLDKSGRKPVKGVTTLYKRVSKEFKTQEGTANETVWAIGTTVEHKNWQPKDEECGSGKFHACPEPYLCDAYRDTADDRYIAIAIRTKDLFAWKNPEHQNKIAFRAGKVLHECDRYGKQL